MSELEHKLKDDNCWFSLVEKILYLECLQPTLRHPPFSNQVPNIVLLLEP